MHFVIYRRRIALPSFHEIIFGSLFAILLGLTACGGSSSGLQVQQGGTNGSTTGVPGPDDPDPGSTGDGGTGGTSAPVVSQVNVGSISATSAIVTWTTDLSSSSQVLFGGTAAYGSASTTSTTPVTAHSVALSGLTASTTYHFEVVSTASGQTGNSNDSTFTTAAAPQNPTAPAAPTGLIATSINQHRIDLHWTDASNNETSFNVYVAIGSAGNLELVATLGVNSTSYSVTHLHPMRPYRFRVDAVNSVGTSSSGIATAVTHPRADVNGDGRDDLSFMWTNGDYLMGISQGRAADANIFGWISMGPIAAWASIFDTSSGARSFQGDFDGDGKTDLGFTWTANGLIEIRLSSTGGWYGTPQDSLVGQIGLPSLNRMFVGDFDGDGADEIALLTTDGYIHVGHWNKTSNTFDWSARVYGIDPSVGYSTWGKYIFPSNSAARFWVGDFNGDGIDDIAFTWTNGAIIVGFGDGNEGFNFVGDQYAWDATTQSSGWGLYIFPPTSNIRMFVGDFNGDGKDDISFLYSDGNIWTGIAYNYPSSPYTHFSFNPIGTAASWGQYIFPANSNIRWFRGDFNGDGADDLTFLYPDGNIYVGLSNHATVPGYNFHANRYGVDSTGNSGWGQYIYPENSGWRWYSGDFDGDGKYDIGFTFGNGYVFNGFSNGDGSFDWRGHVYGDCPDGTHCWGQGIFPTTSHARFGNDLIYGRTQ